MLFTKGIIQSLFTYYLCSLFLFCIVLFPVGSVNMPYSCLCVHCLMSGASAYIQIHVYIFLLSGPCPASDMLIYLSLMSIAHLCHFKHGVLSLWRPFWIWGTVSLPRTLGGCNWWRIQLAKCTFTSWCHCEQDLFTLCFSSLAFSFPVATDETKPIHFMLINII